MVLERDRAADARVTAVGEAHAAEVAELNWRLSEKAAEHQLVASDLVHANDVIETLKKQLLRADLKPEVTKRKDRTLVDVNQVRDALTETEAKLANAECALNETRKRLAAAEMQVTTCKALMADSLHKQEADSTDFNSEIDRLNARVAELEHQLLYGGSEAEIAVRKQLMAALKKKLEEDAGHEARLQTERQKKSLQLLQKKAEDDLAAMASSHEKNLFEVKTAQETVRLNLVTKMETQHAAEIEALNTQWQKRAAVSQEAVRSLDNAELTSMVLERRQRVLAKVNEAKAKRNSLNLTAASALPPIGESAESAGGGTSTVGPHYAVI